MTDHAPGSGISQRLLLIMAVGAGLAVANIYYSQPLLANIGRAFNASPAAMGGIAMLTQLGVATGIVCLVPLGDIRERRQLIIVLLVGASVSLIAVALAPSYLWLGVASFSVGVSSATPQMLVPFAAHLATPERRGQAVGTVMSGLLIGILLSRVASGYVGTLLGWRAMYWIASLMMVILAIVLATTLPRSQPTSRLTYPRLMQSLGRLILTEPVLRESAIVGSMLFGAFCVFWATLAFHLEAPPLFYGSRVAGLFGLIGAVGAAIAPLAGRLADRLNARANLRVAVYGAAAAFGLLWIFGHTIAGLLVGVILLDAGVQGGHVINQSRIHTLRPEVRNRLNTIYIFAFFLGGSAGSALGAAAWQRWQWSGVSVVGLGMLLLAGATLATPAPPEQG
ncbi:MAG TPA: MFS transporter [Vicinamibacterales bacterium]